MATQTTKPRVSISIRVDPEFAAVFKRIAAEEERSVSWMARRALREFVESHEEEE